MLLKIVSDEELITSQIVKTILLVVLSAGVIYNLIRIFRNETRIRLIINASFLILLLFALFLVYNEYREEASLLRSQEYTTGTTIGYCSAFARGEGIEFEYEVSGIRYRNCNTFHPISKDSIQVPNGKYFVRYSQKYPEKGRIDFKKSAP